MPTLEAGGVELDSGGYWTEGEGVPDPLVLVVHGDPREPQGGLFELWGRGRRASVVIQSSHHGQPALPDLRQYVLDFTTSRSLHRQGRPHEWPGSGAEPCGSGGFFSRGDEDFAVFYLARGGTLLLVAVAGSPGLGPDERRRAERIVRSIRVKGA